MIDYAELKPFGFIPGEYEMVCQGCHQKWALMAATATHCKRCAKTALKNSIPKDPPCIKEEFN
jgi:predicted amidophosphoribosyltransferase